jgi:hypothetical protein
VHHSAADGTKHDEPKYQSFHFALFSQGIWEHTQTLHVSQAGGFLGLFWRIRSIIEMRKMTARSLQGCAQAVLLGSASDGHHDRLFLFARTWPATTVTSLL